MSKHLGGLAIFLLTMAGGGLAWGDICEPIAQRVWAKFDKSIGLYGLMTTNATAVSMALGSPDPIGNEWRYFRARLYPHAPGLGSGLGGEVEDVKRDSDEVEKWMISLCRSAGATNAMEQEMWHKIFDPKTPIQPKTHLAALFFHPYPGNPMPSRLNTIAHQARIVEKWTRIASQALKAAEQKEKKIDPAVKSDSIVDRLVQFFHTLNAMGRADLVSRLDKLRQAAGDLSTEAAQASKAASRLRASLEVASWIILEAHSNVHVLKGIIDKNDVPSEYYGAIRERAATDQKHLNQVADGEIFLHPEAVKAYLDWSMAQAKKKQEIFMRTRVDKKSTQIGWDEQRIAQEKKELEKMKRELEKLKSN